MYSNKQEIAIRTFIIISNWKKSLFFMFYIEIFKRCKNYCLHIIKNRWWWTFTLCDNLFQCRTIFCCQNLTAKVGHLSSESDIKCWSFVTESIVKSWSFVVRIWRQKLVLCRQNLTLKVCHLSSKSDFKSWSFVFWIWRSKFVLCTIPSLWWFTFYLRYYTRVFHKNIFLFNILRGMKINPFKKALKYIFV